MLQENEPGERRGRSTEVGCRVAGRPPRRGEGRSLGLGRRGGMPLRQAAFAGALVLFASRAVLAQSERPRFSLSIEPCGETLEAPVGASFEEDFSLVLTTEDNPEPRDGAQAWSLSVVAEGVRIVDITTAGTVAASVSDDPPGLRSGGFVVNELSTGGGKSSRNCVGRLGAVSAVVLSFTKPISLPAEGSETVARITALGQAPAVLGESVPARIEYLDGCAGTGGAVMNAVTWIGMSTQPTFGGCDFDVVAVHPEFVRGDANDDGSVDISDAVAILGCKFLGSGCSSCRDTMDVNDDGKTDVSDPIYALLHLFLGGPRPVIPFPACGPDPTPDDGEGCLHYASCEGSR